MAQNRTGERRVSAQLLELDGISAGFGSHRVLEDLHLSVAPGEIVALVGASGSGKSTLLSLLTGAVRAGSGEIRYGGTVIDPAAMGALRPFASMPQRDVLLPWRNMVDNACIGLEVAGIPKREARQRAAALFPPFGLTGSEHRFPRQLSGGMRQRVSFLRTVVQEKPVLLLDEPFGALDAITRDDLQRWLLTIWEQHGWSILLITHDIREAVRLADRALVLGGGSGGTTTPGSREATGARIVAEVAVSRDIPRDDRFLLDPRVPVLEAQLQTALGRVHVRDTASHTTPDGPR